MQDGFLEAWPKICGLFVEIDKKGVCSLTEKPSCAIINY